MPALGDLARRHGWPGAALINWLCTPNGRLDEDRPVDHITDEARVLQVARDSFTTSW